jgi:predicted RNase H-like nuclease (RuvC/YqgF family)
MSEELRDKLNERIKVLEETVDVQDEKNKCWTALTEHFQETSSRLQEKVAQLEEENRKWLSLHQQQESRIDDLANAYQRQESQIAELKAALSPLGSQSPTFRSERE